MPVYLSSVYRAPVYKSRAWLNESFRGLFTGLAMVATVVSVGVAGYMLIERWSFLDALFMTVITLSTVGFHIVHPLTPAGQIFTCALIVVGVGVAAYAFSQITRIIVEGELKRLRGLNRMHKRIASFHDHTIICGFGRLARMVVPELMAQNRDVVVVEKDPARITDLEAIGAPYVEGTAYEDDSLKAAGIARAKNLLTFLPNDADNVYVTLCARDLNANLNIVARTEGGIGEHRLLRAGANQVLSPYRVSASRVVQQLTRPNVSDFLEVASGHNGAQLILEEVRVPQDSPLSGRTLEQSDLRNRTGVIIAAVIDQAGVMNFNPGRESVIQSGSTMIVLGKPDSVEKLSELLIKQ